MHRKQLESFFLLVTIYTHLALKHFKEVFISILPPYPPPLFFLSLCWGCLFSLSMHHCLSGMCIVEWSSVLCSHSVSLLESCAHQKYRNIAANCSFLGVAIDGCKLGLFSHTSLWHSDLFFHKNMNN